MNKSISILLSDISCFTIMANLTLNCSACLILPRSLGLHVLLSFIVFFVIFMSLTLCLSASFGGEEPRHAEDPLHLAHHAQRQLHKSSQSKGRSEEIRLHPLDSGTSTSLFQNTRGEILPNMPPPFQMIYYVDALNDTIKFYHSLLKKNGTFMIIVEAREWAE